MRKNKTEKKNPKNEPAMPNAAETPDIPKNFGSAIKKLIKCFKVYWIPILIAIVLSGAGSLLTVLGTDKLSEMSDIIKDGIISGIDKNKVADTGMILIIMYAAGAVFSSLQGIIMTAVTQKTSKKLRGQMSEKIQRLPMSYFNRIQTGDVLSRFTNDVDTICESMNMSISGLVSSLILFFGSLVMMFVTDWIMTVTALVSTIIGFIFMALIMGNAQKYFVLQQERLGAVNGYIEEMYSGHLINKAFNGEAAAKMKFDEENEKLRDSNFHAEYISGLLMPIMTFMGHLGYVSVCVVGALLTMNGRISFGAIVAFMIYISYFTQPLAQIAQGAQSLQSAAAAGERVFELLDEKELYGDDHAPARLENVRGDVCFYHISFGYEGTGKTVIKDFTADIKCGQKVAIVGSTGAGKTTLVNLLMRFYELNDGAIYIDNIPICDVSRENLRDQFCMVLQDAWIFEGTIRENLVLADEDVSDARLDEVCKAVGLHHFIMTLPNGYDTILNDKVTLSEGQMQQLAIARAMIADNNMLILDEATSSVDTRLEQQIQEAMDSLMQGRTSFVIAHRLSTIINADVILVMQDGDIVESGTHNELLEKNGVYAELYNSQFENI